MKEEWKGAEVTDFQPGRLVTLGAASCGSEFRAEFRLSRAGEGTLIEQTTTWRPVTFFAWVMSPMAMLMKGSMRKMMAKDLDDAMRSLEGG